MATQQPLDPSFLDNLVKKADTKTSSPGRKKSAPDTADRSYTTWFKLYHNLQGTCNVPDHKTLDPDSGLTIDRNRAVVNIGLYDVCRFCYVSSQDIINAAEMKAPHNE